MDINIVKQRIADIEAPRPKTYDHVRESSRWPYTYAWDFVRQHATHFSEIPEREDGHMLSRADVAGFFYKAYDGDYDKIKPIAEELAEAYYREWYTVDER